MTTTLSAAADITLDAFERVAWQGEPVAISTDALAVVDAARASFMRLLERPETVVYGVTSGYGDRAGIRLSADERVSQARAAGLRGASFGEPLPVRVVRGIVLARLANFLDGHAAVSSQLVAAVAELLDGRRLPLVPAQGNGGSGEILALGHLFGSLTAAGLGEKEGLALINGSPCAAALVADAALAGRARLQLAYDVFALSVEAFRAPLEAYDPALAALWGDPDEARALAALRSRLDGSAERRSHQGPVAYRILPRALGEAERALAGAREAAAVSLRSVTDNPVYLPPTPEHPDGRTLSTGGYHNAAAAAALHRLAVVWADLGQLAERHVERLVFASAEPSDAAELARTLLMVAGAYVEEGRAAALPPLLARGGPGQNDVSSPGFLAWSRHQAAAQALDAVLAILAAAACAALGGREVAASLTPVIDAADEVAAALAAGGGFGEALGRLADRFHALAYAGALPTPAP